MTAARSVIDDPRATQLLVRLRREGPLSRQDLHERTGLRPNTVGDLVESLLEVGVLREDAPQVAGKGRPRVPLDIDPDRRRVVGVALEPGRVRAATFNLRGEPVGPPVQQRAPAARIIDTAAELLASLPLDPVLVVGLSTTGFVDVPSRQLLISSTKPRSRPVSLTPLYTAAGGLPLIVENDLQALAIQWMLTHEAEAQDDILLIFIRDGAIGAAVLVDGRPIKGCVMGGNELGHTRLPIDTARCYCGHVGCLERIVSTEFLRSRGGDPSQTLLDAAAAYRDDGGPMGEIAGHLAMAIGNAINLLRPRRVVLASELNPCRAFTDDLVRRVRGALLDALVDRVRVDLWDRVEVDFAEAAGWLALASIYRKEWLISQ